MKKGICPKCSGQEVYSNCNLRDKTGNYNSNTIPLSFFRTVALDHYVCTTCGYIENYVADSSALERIRDMWEKVEPE